MSGCLLQTMDTIVTSILSSEHPDTVKKELLKKIINSDTAPLDIEVSRSLVTSAIAWSLNEESSIHREFGETVLGFGGKRHPAVLKDVVSNALHHQLKSSPTGALFDSILFILNAIPSEHRHECYTTVRRALCGWLSNSDVAFHSLATVAKMARLLTRYPDCVPSTNTVPTSLLNRKFLIYLAHCEWPTHSGKRHRCSLPLEEFKAVSTFLEMLWLRNSDIVTVSLKTILTSISSNGGFLVRSFESRPGFQLGACLALALCALPPSQVASACNCAIFDCSLDAASLGKSLAVMLDWLLVIPVAGLSYWVTKFMEGMLEKKLFAQVLSVLLPRLEMLFTSLPCRSVGRREVLPVLRHVLLGVQHAPVCFLKVRMEAPGVMCQLEEEGTPESMDILMQLARIFRCLVQRFNDIPVDTDFLLCINKYDLSTPQVLAAMLAGCSWRTFGTGKRGPQQETGGKKKSPFQIAGKAVDLKAATRATSASTRAASHSSLLAPRRSLCGKAGLVNLGNTCYVNSVLQALFMNTEFRQSVLTASAPARGKSVIAELQRVMAHLLLTDRQAFSPREFLEIARPSHFLPGTQQDCAEFCRHVLDSIHTYFSTKSNASESAPSPSATTGAGVDAGAQAPVDTPDCVERHFQLKLCTTYTCKGCGHESSQTESAYDLMLAFPAAPAATATPVMAMSAAQRTLTSPEQPAAKNHNLLAASESPAILINCDANLPTPPNTPPQTACVSQAETTSYQMTGERSSPYDVPVLDTPRDSPSKPLSTDASSADTSVLPDADVSSSSAATTGIRGGERPPAAAAASPLTTSSTAEKPLRTGPLSGSHVSSTDGEKLTDLLDNFLSVEMLEGDNAYECGSCESHQPGQRRVRIVQAPDQLLITLMRFHFDRATLQRSKIMTKVHYPRFLRVPCTKASPALSRARSSADDVTHHVADDVTHHVADDEPMNDAEGMDVSTSSVLSSDKGSDAVKVNVYELSAQIVHAGNSTEHGHYYSYARETQLPVDTAPPQSRTPPHACASAMDVSSGAPAKALGCGDVPMVTGESIPAGLTQLDYQQEQQSAAPCSNQHDTATPRTWYRLNDSSVEFSALDVARNVGQSTSDTVYMLVYSKCPNSPRHCAVSVGSSSSSKDTSVTEDSLPSSLLSPTTPLSSAFTDYNPSKVPGPNCPSIIPAHLVLDVEEDNLKFAKERSATAARVEFGPEPAPTGYKPPPPPPPPSGCGGGGFSGPVGGHWVS